MLIMYAYSYICFEINDFDKIYITVAENRLFYLEFWKEQLSMCFSTIGTTYQLSIHMEKAAVIV